MFINSLKNKCKIKICYPVFDGTVPPLEWVEFINNNFDICVSPSDYVAHNLKRYGVKKDCFGLKAVVMVDEYLDIYPKENKKFRFGCISGNERRKNLEFLVECFSEAFSKEDNVELYVHSCDRGDITSSSAQLRECVEKCSEKSNIILNENFVSADEIKKIWASFNAYVIPQTNTGYFTTPLEALAAGLPVILSDIPAHREMLKYVNAENNLFFVPHDILRPEYHFFFDYRNIGVGFASDKNSYIKALRQLYENRKFLCSEKCIENRKKEAVLLSVDALRKDHNTVINPDKISLSEYSHVENGTFFMSEELAEKYKKYFGKEISDVKSNSKETVFKTESSPVFKMLEEEAVISQKIWLELYKKAEEARKKMEENKILFSKYMQKLIYRAKKYNIDKLPKFVYKIFSIYCKIKRFFHPEKNMSNV